MAEDSIALVPLRKTDVEVGKPLPFAVYDGHRKLLMNAGVVVGTEAQLDRLLADGLYREDSRNRPPSDPTRVASLRTEATTDSHAPVKPQEETLDLAEIKLMPGDALNLQPLLEGQAERWTVNVIGQLNGKSLLVTAPMVDGKLIFIKDGQTYLVRAFSGLNVVAFKARVLKSQHQPFPYLHLAWPESVKAMRIRKAMRAPASIIVAVHESEEGRQTGAGKTMDISVGGAKVLSPMALGDQGKNIWISFKVKLGDMEEYVKTHAVIRFVGEEPDENGKMMKAFGLQFDALTQAQRLIIMNLVYQFLLKEPT